MEPLIERQRLLERSVVSNQYSTSFVEIHKNTYLGHLPNISQI